MPLRMNHTALAALCALLSSPAGAALVDLGSGAVYDSARNVTWTKNVRYFELDLADNNRLYPIIGTVVANSDGSTHTVTEDDLYQVVPAGTFRVGGTWWGATAWAQTLDYADSTNWRLPTSIELVDLLNDSGFPSAFDGARDGTFSYLMWTSTEPTPETTVQVQTVPYGSPAYYTGFVPKSQDQRGPFISVMWAVHDGNISAIPEPSTLLLVGTCAIWATMRRPRNSEPKAEASQETA